MGILSDFHRAAKIIESDGIGGLQVAKEILGEKLALLLLVAHLRRSEGSMNGWSSDPDIGPKVNGILSEKLPGLYAIYSKYTALFYTVQWHCFDNFSAFAVTWRGRVYPTVEHAYQAAKFIDADGVFALKIGDMKTIAEMIRESSSPDDAKEIGNLFVYKEYIRKDWKDVKLLVMEEILRAKHSQHKRIQKVLESSKGMLLVEDSSTDSFWGRGPEWEGQNNLGKIWMKIRDGA